MNEDSNLKNRNPQRDFVEVEKNKDVSSDSIESEDAFEFEPNPEDLDFTLRSALMGSILGSIISLSNIYLGLKIGITQGATLFATLLGGAMMKPYLTLFDKINKKHTIFGPKEHCCFQAAATASGSLNGGLIAGVIGLFWMQDDATLTDEQRASAFIGGASNNIIGLFLLVLAAVGYGTFLAVPYRTVFIVNQNLQFPDGLAAAEILKSMYKKGRTAAHKAIQSTKVKVMMWSFGIGVFLYLLSVFFPVLISWPIFRNLSSCAPGQSIDDCLANPPQVADEENPGSTRNVTNVSEVMALAAAWGWAISIDPVLVGTAFIVPAHVNLWFFMGGFVAYGIMGPICLAIGDYPEGLSYGEAISFIKDKTILWPAIFAVLVASFINIALEYKAFDGMLGGFKNNDNDNRSLFQRQKDDIAKMFKKYEGNVDRSDENTPFIVWFSIMLVLMVVSFIIYTTFFNIEYSMGIQAWHVVVSMGSCFLLALVYLQILGKTNWGLISVMGKVIVMILGVAGAPLAALLMMGNLVGQTMSQIGDLIQCYKTGSQIRASPQAQFLSNCIGTFFGMFAAVGGFLLFTISTPCILEYPTPESCPFKVPSARAWYSLAVGFSNGFEVGNTKDSTMTSSGLYVTIVFSVLAVITNSLKKVFQNKVSPDTYSKYQGFFPLYSVMFVPFLIPTEYAVATLIGTLIKLVWARFNKEAVNHYSISVGAGLMTGGALGGVIFAIMKIAGLPNDAVLNWGNIDG